MEAEEKPLFLKELIVNLGLQRPVLVSPSMSGSYSLPFIMDYQDMISAYIPVAPVGTNVYTPEQYQSIKVNLHNIQTAKHSSTTSTLFVLDPGSDCLRRKGHEFGSSIQNSLTEYGEWTNFENRKRRTRRLSKSTGNISFGGVELSGFGQELRSLVYSRCVS